MTNLQARIELDLYYDAHDLFEVESGKQTCWDDDTALDDAAEEARIHDLAKAVVRALTPSNGRKSPCEEDELRERLEQGGAVYNSSDLPPALSVLENNDGSIPGLPYVLQRPLPDIWQGPSP